MRRLIRECMAVGRKVADYGAPWCGEMGDGYEYTRMRWKWWAGIYRDLELIPPTISPTPMTSRKKRPSKRVKCAHCHTLYVRMRDWQRYCSARCRSRAFEAYERDMRLRKRVEESGLFD